MINYTFHLLHSPPHKWSFDIHVSMMSHKFHALWHSDLLLSSLEWPSLNVCNTSIPKIFPL